MTSSNCHYRFENSMTDQAKASQLTRAGFELWQEGRLEESVAKYREALGCADPNHYALGDYHGEFAGVLATLGRNAEAREQYELALAESLRQDASAYGPGASIARYFLCEHLLKMGAPAQALAVVQARPESLSKQEWALRFVEARALWELGRREESKKIAVTAVELAPTDQKRSEIREELAFILDAGGA
jgi:tetratricopeptide (TPR) repeat protein